MATEYVGVRLDVDTYEQIETYREALKSANHGAAISMSEAIRALLRAGLAELAPSDEG